DPVSALCRLREIGETRGETRLPHLCCPMGSVERESELGRIDRIRRLAGAPRGSGVVLGIGDDCAIFRQRGATEDLVFTTDMLVEDVHFRRETHRPEDAGWKALARGLSDIAAMG